MEAKKWKLRSLMKRCKPKRSARLFEMEFTQRISIMRRRRKQEGGMFVHIYDTGPGIHAHAVAKVFDAGYSTRKEGCGMGLAICRQALAAINGCEIRLLNSILMFGSLFEIFIPDQHLMEYNNGQTTTAPSPIV